MSNRQATAEVLAMGEINFEGNIIPHEWYQNITDESGKPAIEAIILLSEIVYWYRPTYQRDEANGQIIAYERKFKGDALEKSKKSLAKQFNFTERKVQESLGLLEKLGLISREFRTVEISDGVNAANIMFIKIHPEKIKSITFKNSIGIAEIYHTPPTKSTIGWTEKRDPYSYNTKTTLEKKKKKEKTASPVSIEFSKDTNEFVGITESDMADWQKLYPGVDISRELGMMRQWLMDLENPKRTGNRTFITNWLRKSHQDAQKRPSKPATQSSHTNIASKDDDVSKPYYIEILANRYKAHSEDRYVEYLKGVREPEYYNDYLKSKSQSGGNK